MKVTVEIITLTHRQLTPYRVFRLLDRLAWRFHRLDNVRDAHGFDMQTGTEMIRVSVKGAR